MSLSHPGIGVMLHALSGGGRENADAVRKSLGKRITRLAVDDNRLVVEFDDGKLEVWDAGQSCCESRYMSTEDDLQYFVGGTLIGIEVVDAPNLPEEYGDHEIQFLDVYTSKGSFQCANHNEHNGYYGGFGLESSYTPKG